MLCTRQEVSPAVDLSKYRAQRESDPCRLLKRQVNTGSKFRPANWRPTRYLFTRSLRRECSRAARASYVLVSRSSRPS
jgi:hypothetical protein